MNNGTVVGVEPEDTIASYKTLDGRTLVTPSNRVHIYSPRFMAVRQVIGVQQSDQLARTAGVYRPDRLSLGERTQITANAKQNVQTEGEIGRKLLTTYAAARRRRPLGGHRTQRLPGQLLAFENIAVLRTGTYEQGQMAWLARGTAAAIAWEKKQSVQVMFSGRTANALVGNQQTETIFTISEPPGRPKLRVIKVASTPFANRVKPSISRSASIILATSRWRT